jgi:hypothetical protein
MYIQNDREFEGTLRVVGSVSYAIQTSFSISFKINIYCGPNSVVVSPPNSFI